MTFNSPTTLVDQLTLTPTWVYYVYDGQGALLYIGVTSNMQQRMKQHRKSSAWHSQAEWAAVELYSDRTQAEAVEANAIVRRTPPFNSDVNRRLVKTEYLAPEALIHDEWLFGVMARG